MTPIAGRWVAAALVTVAVAAAGPAACGDGRPAFCDDLARNAELTPLRRALTDGDLAGARGAADRFAELADAAPDDVRPALRDLAGGVGDLVDLLAADRAAAGSADAEAAVRRREELDREMAQLGRRSSQVEAWASRECGLELGTG